MLYPRFWVWMIPIIDRINLHHSCLYCTVCLCMNNMMLRNTAVSCIPYSTSHDVQWPLSVKIASYSNSRVVVPFAHENLSVAAAVIESTTLLLEALSVSHRIYCSHSSVISNSSCCCDFVISKAC